MRLSVNHTLPLILIAALSSHGVSAKPRDQLPPPVVNGPAADYPVVVGPPFQVGSATYTPEDKLNYDAVGHATIGMDGGTTVSAAHKTLPLPSYVEVTALDSGKTILVRVERRGPMSDRLIELSPGAAAQLGFAEDGGRMPVRVRRVNPPEQERAMLRSGQRAPERMATPKGLLDALVRRLGPPDKPETVLSPAPRPAGAAVATARPAAAPTPPSTQTPPRTATNPRVSKNPRVTQTGLTELPRPDEPPAAVPAPHPVPTRIVSAPRPAPTAPAPVAGGSLVVQVAAFSTEARADGVAAKVGGRVTPAGRVWRVRMGPFATRGDAEAALAKARSAGYSDARIQRAD